MMAIKTISTFSMTAVALATLSTHALAQAPAAPPQRPTASVNQQPRVDVLGMTRPIEMHDSVWIEDLTMMEVRDLLKAGLRSLSVAPSAIGRIKAALSAITIGSR